MIFSKVLPVSGPPPSQSGSVQQDFHESLWEEPSLLPRVPPELQPLNPAAPRSSLPVPQCCGPPCHPLPTPAHPRNGPSILLLTQPKILSSFLAYPMLSAPTSSPQKGPVPSAPGVSLRPAATRQLHSACPTAVHSPSSQRGFASHLQVLQVTCEVPRIVRLGGREDGTVVVGRSGEERGRSV